MSRLRDGGADVRDHGDRAVWRWRPDRARPRAQTRCHRLGRNEGLLFATAMDALGALLRSPKLAGLTITECNPDHAEEGADGLERLAATVAAALTGS